MDEIYPGLVLTCQMQFDERFRELPIAPGVFQYGNVDRNMSGRFVVVAQLDDDGSVVLTGFSWSPFTAEDFTDP